MKLFHIFFLITTIAILVYGTDDLLMDIYYWARMGVRFVRRRRMPALTLEKLNACPEQRIALMIPCWQESNVLAEMLSNTMSTLSYDNYDVFVGVYPNDLATNQALAPSLKKNTHIHEITGPVSGPTTKADNLNAIYAGILEHEKKNGVHFDIFIMHDAEDVIHPLSLKLYNYLLPHKDMVQIPVFPLKPQLSWFTHWTYADEFAENHTKDMICREWVGGFVPSAGVGTAFSRQAFDKLFDKSKGELFSAETLTEDYAFSSLSQSRRTKRNLCSSIGETTDEPTALLSIWPARGTSGQGMDRYASTFPTKICQRHSTEEPLGSGDLAAGMEGDWLVRGKATRYSLLRDRKGPLGYLLLSAAYVILAYWIFYQVSFWWTGHAVVPALRPLDRTLIILVIVMMVHRLLERAVAVWRIYGWAPALFSVPLTFYLNIINIHAFMRALSLFIRSDIKQEPVPWAKTTNQFPSVAQLVGIRRRLGDLLIENSSISSKDLAHALHIQHKTKAPLGRILVGEGTITEDQLQSSLRRLI